VTSNNEQDKNLGGRPLSYKTVEELQAAVDLYFDTDAYIEVGGEDKAKMYAPTMSGLALSLGVDRKTITNYANRDEFFPTIKKARTRVEVALEQRLYGNNVTGIIFNLKNNFDWSDKQEIKQETTHKIEESLAERLTGGSKR
jgi:hypothetical protein